MESTYIIGEIGQNHNGSVDIAKLIIDLASKPVYDELFNIQLKPMDAVKLTKRDLNYELTNSAMNKVYDSVNSFGKTYGEHRQYLELDYEGHLEIYKYAKSKDLDLIETLCAPSCLEMLNYFIPDKLKVASRDLTNLVLLEAMAETKIPIILSTGMSGKKELDIALEIITKYHSDIQILHCLSQYPADYNHLNLNTIQYMIEEYPKFEIGYSDHSIGIFVPVAAVAMGAKVIEKHITLDRKMKGTDQSGSLGPDGVNRMVRDIRLLEISKGQKNIFASSVIGTAKKKLERSIATNKNIEKGQRIFEKDIHLLSPGDGIRWHDKQLIIGKVSKSKIPKNEIIYNYMIE